MTYFIEISEEAFAAIFSPQKNHLDPNASFDFGEGHGSLFETYGRELAFVQQQERQYIWTLCDGDNGLFIASGCHFVNRLGYFVCAYPLPDGVHVEIPLDEVESERDKTKTPAEC